MKSKFTWIFTLIMAFFIQLSFAQQKTISGVVTDPSGVPVPGVNVKVISANNVVQTDFDGKFTVTAAVNDKIEFSYVGFTTQTVTVGAANAYNIQMQEPVLDDLVIEGYRSTTRPLSNVAVNTVTSKTIEGRPNASFIQTLQGQVPGLNITTGSGQPGSNSTVILRGYGSVNGNVEPLYVVDGVPLNSDNFRSINPNDIESISVLKDAGATSIYGNRGANGVIIVKTKRGGFKSSLDIKYTGVSGFTTMQDNKYNRMNSRQLLTLENTAGRGLGSTLTADEIANYGTNTDWYKELFRTGVSQNHNLAITSGGEKLNSFTSLGYFDQEGIVQGTDLKRFNFRNNLSGVGLNDKFRYSTSTTVNFSRRNEASNLGQGSININPVAGANNSAPYISPGQYTGSQDLFDLYQQDGTLLYTPLFLLDRLKTGRVTTDELKMIFNAQASYSITDELTIGTSIGSDYTQAVGLNVQDPVSFNSLLFQQSGEEYLGFQNESFAREFAFNANTSINYTKTFGEKHTIDASVFTEYYKAHSKSFQYTQNGLNPKVFEPGNGAGYIDPNPYGDTPQFYIPTVSSGKATAGLFSYFGSVDYDYNKRYGFAASVRRDASYRFAETNRWGTFWSVSGRWNIDQEDFMQGSSFDLLKLRASYGTSGNQNIAGQSVFTLPNSSRTLYASGTGYVGLPSYVLGQIGNPDIMWETIAQANVGVDIEMFKSKLRASFDVYQKTTQDLYQDAQISGTTGQFTLTSNNGNMRNAGVEALIAYDVVSTNDFRLTLNFNGSYNKNTMRDIPNPDGFVDLDSQALVNGGSFAQYYLVKYAGVNPTNGNLLFYTKDGQLTETPSTDDRVLTGKAPIPTYQGGFGFDADYKGFYLTTQFSFVADIWRFDSDLEGLQDPSDIGVFNKSTDLFNAWTPDNRYTDIPSLSATNLSQTVTSDRYLKDASYVRLRYVSLGYNFKKNLLEKTPFTALRAYVQAENLFTLSKWRGWDAESPRAGDVYQYPTPRIFSVGLEVGL